jgi:3-hydroxyisobutyrate dehydrogenase
MLTDTDAVMSIARDQGVLAALPPGAIWVQMSTIGIEGTERVAAMVRVERPDVTLLDAPVSGSKEPAEQGQLTIFASGPEAVRWRVATLFDALGQRTMWVGAVGAGTRLKLVNNTWLAFATEAVATSVALARRLGVATETVMEALIGGPLVSPWQAAKLQRIANGEFSAQFALSLALKDVRLAQQAAGDDRFSVLTCLADEWQQVVDQEITLCGVVVEPIEVGAVLPKDAFSLLCRNVVLLDYVVGDLTVNWPVTDGVWEIARPHDVFEHVVPSPDAKVIGQEGHKHIAMEILARQEIQFSIRIQAVAEARVQLAKVVRNPAAVDLRADEFQTRMALEYTSKEQATEHAGEPAFPRRRLSAGLGPFIWRHPAQHPALHPTLFLGLANFLVAERESDVDPDWDTSLFDVCPKPIVLGAGLLRRAVRVTLHRDTLETQNLHATTRLSHRVVDACVGNQAAAEKAVGSVAVVLCDPVVVRLEAGQLELVVRELFDGGPDQRIVVEDLGVDPVLFLFRDPGRGIERTSENIFVPDTLLAVAEVVLFEPSAKIGAVISFGRAIDDRCRTQSKAALERIVALALECEALSAVRAVDSTRPAALELLRQVDLPEIRMLVDV